MSVSCDPQAMVTTATPLQAIPDGFQLSQAISLFAQWAGVAVDANALAKSASSLQGLYGSEADVLIALLAKKTAGSTDANTLSKLASCVDCIPEGARMMVLNSILCEIVQGSGGSITLPGDPDTANFVCGWLNICAAQTGACTSTNNCPPGTQVPIDATCASFCGITQQIVDALQTLVTSLKSAGLWDLMDVIYPFVGGNPGSCSLNLKDITKFAITWHGSVSFSLNGVTGDGSTGYGDTTFNPSTDGVNFKLNSAAMGAYINQSNQSDLMGAFSITGQGCAITVFGGPVVGGFMNCNILGLTPTLPYGAPPNGNYVVSRTASNSTTLYIPSGVTSNTVAASGTLTPFSLYILSCQNSGVPTNFNTATMKFAWAGKGFSGAQVTALETIITAFEATLNRA